MRNFLHTFAPLSTCNHKHGHDEIVKLKHQQIMESRTNQSVTPDVQALMLENLKLAKRVEVLENTLSAGKEVLTLEEAARFMGVTKSSLYKMTHEQTIPYYKPNGKMVYFEKAELLTWIRRNAIASKAQVSEEANRILKNLSVK